MRKELRISLTIDWELIKEIGGFRMGPFELMDYIGNDINYTVTETVFTSFYFDSKIQTIFYTKKNDGSRIFWKKIWKRIL